MRIPFEVRFWAKVQKADCWLWTGAAVPGTHGAYGSGGRRLYRTCRGITAARWSKEHPEAVRAKSARWRAKQKQLATSP